MWLTGWHDDSVVGADVNRLVSDSHAQRSLQNHDQLVFLVSVQRRSHADPDFAHRSVNRGRAVALLSDEPLPVVRPPRDFRSVLVVNDWHGLASSRLWLIGLIELGRESEQEQDAAEHIYGGQGRERQRVVPCGVSDDSGIHRRGQQQNIHWHL